MAGQMIGSGGSGTADHCHKVRSSICILKRSIINIVEQARAAITARLLGRCYASRSSLLLAGYRGRTRSRQTIFPTIAGHYNSPHAHPE